MLSSKRAGPSGDREQRFYRPLYTLAVILFPSARQDLRAHYIQGLGVGEVVSYSMLTVGVEKEAVKGRARVNGRSRPAAY